MKEDFEHPLLATRRQFLSRSAAGIGSLALGSLLSPQAFAEDQQAAIRNALHFAPKAKRVIYLYMAGGPSHLESFDFKPELARLNGQPMPKSVTDGEELAQLQGADLWIMGPQKPFGKHGQSGQEISGYFPHIAEVADDICIVRSMKTEQINHDPAHTFMNTGTSISGRPSMGSWLSYGLGSESKNLPSFVVLSSNTGVVSQPISARQWHSGFLPSKHQGVEFRSLGDPVLYIQNPDGVSKTIQRDVIDAVKKLSTLRNDVVDEPEIATRLSQYEMAFQMQTSVPELADFSQEPDHVLDLYGTKGADGSFAANCLMARRLAERGVRFTQIYHRGWDHHAGIKALMPAQARSVDQASAALIKDLKQRGMLDDTLVIWGGEFGRTPMAQGTGRDHHINGFSIWMAGGGVKGGITHGATDDFGYNAVEDVVHVNDLHATILRLFGINHEKLTYRYQGRDFRLTDVAGKAVPNIIA
jgi:hypothetical protein